MPVIVKKLEKYQDTVTPPGLNEETTIIVVTPQENVYLVEGYLDLGNLDVGDAVVITEYVAVDGVNYRVFGTAGAQGPQAEPVLRFHTKTLHPLMKYKLTLTQTSGTVRSFPYAFIVEVLGEL
ncbi:MAG: hypothetical protein QXT64_05680 [Desulfurococcaceae archaeon]